MNGMLEDRVALVTGGRGGCGRAICERFEAEGAHVYAGDLSPSGSLSEGEAPFTFLRMDVTSETEVTAAFDTIMAEHGRLDVLVNAAGIALELTIDDTTLEQWQHIFAVNVTGTFLASKYGLPLLRASDHASIINFGSYDGYLADPNLAAYCATKGAIHALTRAMACDHGPEGIRVNAICPGYVDTPMLDQFFPDGVEPGIAHVEAQHIHPLRTVGTPTDVANLVTWLASDEARYASGQLWVLDGGLSAQVQQMRF